MFPLLRFFSFLGRLASKRQEVKLKYDLYYFCTLPPIINSLFSDLCSSKSYQTFRAYCPTLSTHSGKSLGGKVCWALAVNQGM